MILKSCDFQSPFQPLHSVRADISLSTKNQSETIACAEKMESITRTYCYRTRLPRQSETGLCTGLQGIRSSGIPLML